MSPSRLLPVCLALLSTCSTPPPSRVVKAQLIEASRGGIITVSASESAELAGTSLDVPAGALAADTRITLERSDDIVAREDVAGPAATWGPAGTRFTKAARMTLPLTQSAAATELTVQLREADGTESELPPSAIAVANGRISFEVTGFTTFQPKRRRVVACPADARLCPDGSSVGRQGPDCAFAPCPGDDAGTACTRDAFRCPDGTVVGRTGPGCEFVCPGVRDGGACLPVVCTLFCPFGFVRDPGTGCEVCSCAPPPRDGGPIACTDDAFRCADGTWVGRTGPDCQFICPSGGDGGLRDAGTACTQDAFMCPDGTWVGRTGPRCEFVCPPPRDAGTCGPVICTLACQYGFARDATTGCEVCACNPPPRPDGGLPCFKGGCSGQLCADQPLGSTCEWRPEYGCYRTATCERQGSGQCAWTPTAALVACLATARDGGP